MTKDNKESPKTKHKKTRTWFGLKKKPAILAKSDLPNMNHEELVDEEYRVLRTDKVVIGTGVAVAAAAAGIWGNKLLGGADLPPPTVSPDQLNPPPASAPADIETGRPDVDMSKIRNASDNGPTVEVAGSDGMSGATKTSGKKRTHADSVPPPAASHAEQTQVPPETPEQKAAREAAYVEATNEGLKVPRSAEKIAADKAIAEKFAKMFMQDSQYKDMAPADVETAVLNGYYKTIDELVAHENVIGLERLAKGERATPEQLQQYFANLANDPAALAAYQNQVRSAVDTAGRYGMNSMGTIVENLANRPRQGGLSR